MTTKPCFTTNEPRVLCFDTGLVCYKAGLCCHNTWFFGHITDWMFVTSRVSFCNTLQHCQTLQHTATRHCKNVYHITGLFCYDTEHCSILIQNRIEHILIQKIRSLFYYDTELFSSLLSYPCLLLSWYRVFCHITVSYHRSLLLHHRFFNIMIQKSFGHITGLFCRGTFGLHKELFCHDTGLFCHFTGLFFISQISLS